MSSYAMQAAPDNGFSVMTNCPSVTQFMLNSFSLLNLTGAISPGPFAAIVLGRRVSAGERALKSRSPPPVMIPRLYSIVLFSA